jgi:hypothetical protein
MPMILRLSRHFTHNHFAAGKFCFHLPLSKKGPANVKLL